MVPGPGPAEPSLSGPENAPLSPKPLLKVIMHGALRHEQGVGCWTLARFSWEACFSREALDPPVPRRSLPPAFPLKWDVRGNTGGAWGAERSAPSAGWEDGELSRLAPNTGGTPYTLLPASLVKGCRNAVLMRLSPSSGVRHHGPFGLPSVLPAEEPFELPLLPPTSDAEIVPAPIEPRPPAPVEPRARHQDHVHHRLWPAVGRSKLFPDSAAPKRTPRCCPKPGAPAGEAHGFNDVAEIAPPA